MQNDIQIPITESLVREVLTSYDKYRGQYRLNTLLVMTPDEIIEQIAEDLKREYAKDQR
jgi:alkanesulfonate monooxygenase SsuD/methylene tetrahydromethanopterin reductase-like flavin-dependent oxidoreductase (luciferase family)